MQPSIKRATTPSGKGLWESRAAKAVGFEALAVELCCKAGVDSSRGHGFMLPGNVGVSRTNLSSLFLFSNPSDTSFDNCSV